jgi:nucleotide-binding universal stress UspA family protein
MRVLVPTDGSPRSLAALRYILDVLARELKSLEVHLLNVQPPLPSAVTSFIAGDVVKGFHQEEGDKALADGRKLLAASGLQHECRVAVGDAAQTIVDYAAEKSCAQIVMSTRGYGPIADLLVGSTARKVLHLARIPVTLVPDAAPGPD